MRIVSPEEAVPLLLDPAISPVVALDSEFKGSPCRAHLRGVSLAGGTPPDGLFGAFWSFEEPWERMPYATFHEKLIRPIMGDPNRTVVMHPWHVDAPLLRARGLTAEMTRCKVEDTIALAYIFDDNLPHGLKDLAYCLLLKTTATSYAATQREIEGIRKQGKKIVNEILENVWRCYKEHRRKSDQIEVEIDPTWPGWKRLAMSAPPGLLKTTSKKTGKMGIVDYARPIIEGVVQADYDRRAQERFELYGAEDALYTLAIRYVMRPTLNQEQLGQLALETEISHPIVTEMHERGLKIDLELLGAINTAMLTATAELQREVIKRWSIPGDEKEFNPGSHDQVARRVWLDWKIRPPPWALKEDEVRDKYRRNKDGLCKADDDVLSWLENKHGRSPVGRAIKRLREYRRWTKLLTTYVAPMLETATEDPDNRIHSSFWPTGARSGRFSSSDPNVENIPRPYTMPTLVIPQGANPLQPPPGLKLETNKDGTPKQWRVESLRHVFITPDDEWTYLSADLSQIENRITAFEARDESMLALFRGWDCAECGSSGQVQTVVHACPNCGHPDYLGDPERQGKRDKTTFEQPIISGFVLGRDIHSRTAVITGLADKYGPKEGRQRGKPVMHGWTYGMGPNKLARNEGMSVKDANRYLGLLDEAYPRVRGDLHPRIKRAIRDQGYVTMFDGHTRRFVAAKILMKTSNLPQWEEEGVIRQGVNVLAQGGTGVVMKRAMVAIRRRFQESPFRGNVYLVNQVHDELLYEARKTIAQQAYEVLTYELEHAAPELPVPVIAEGGMGRTWGEAH